MKNNDSEYLTEKELTDLEKFIAERNISKSEVGRRMGKEGATGVYWFAKKKFKRLIAREFIEKEKEKTMKAFEKVEKI